MALKFAGNAALQRIYGGTAPSDADTALSAQEVLAELTCGTPFAPGASNGVRPHRSTLGHWGAGEVVIRFLVAFSLVVSFAPSSGAGGDVTLVQDVMRQLKLRRQGAALRAFIRDRGLGKARSNLEFEALVADRVASGKLKEDDLVTFFHDATLFSHKWVFVLKNEHAGLLAKELGLPFESKGLELLRPNVGAGARRPPAAHEKKTPGYYFGTFDETAHIFVTARPVMEREELDHSALNEESRAKLAGKRYTTPRAVSIQCFDVFLRVGKRTLLLVDAPPHIDRDVVRADVAKYHWLINKDLEPVFEDLWNAVGGIYGKKREGNIEHIKFMSNQRSTQHGTLGKVGPIKDYRKLPYHRGGSRAGAVDVHAIGVSWDMKGGEKAYALLPGTPRHLLRSKVDGRMFPPLDFFDTPEPMTRRSLEHAASRVIAYL